ncbi:hypothetical protein VCHA53O466_40455 [Vibrio chagasii]|nr:hypothetical protein VCHA53O466_40455 [Vibrio chagasii]
MKNATPNHQEQIQLDKIHGLEQCIASLIDELDGADEQHWRTKESRKLLADDESEKSDAITHYNNMFGREYEVELHQLKANIEQVVFLLSTTTDEEWRIACMYSKSEATELNKQYTAKLSVLNKQLTEMLAETQTTYSSEEKIYCNLNHNTETEHGNNLVLDMFDGKPSLTLEFYTDEGVIEKSYIDTNSVAKILEEIERLASTFELDTQAKTKASQFIKLTSSLLIK